MVLVLPLNIVAIILSNVTMHSMVEEAEVSVQNVLEAYMSEIESKMTTTGYFLYTVRNEEAETLAMLNAADSISYENTKIHFYYKVNNLRTLVNGADVYFFYVTDRDDIMSWSSMSERRNPRHAFLREKFETGSELGWNHNEIEQRQILSLFVKLPQTIYGGWIYLDTIVDELEKDIHYETAEFYFTEEKMVSEKKLMANVYSEKGGVYLSCCWDKGEVIGEISRIYKILQILAMVELCIIPMLYLMISHLLLKPLQTMNRAHQYLQDGNLNYRITQKGNSVEFDYSFQSFNLMAGKIHDLKIESYEKELERQKMELKNLQLQIRPHFLLNTFNLIYTLLQRNEPLAVQRIILYLSDYFRYLFRSGSDLELFEKEIHLIEEYIHMAKVRYPDSIEFTYEVDPEIHFVRVPPLLLHNFVENIVKHVVQQGIMTHISLIGQYEEKTVVFMIMDDGPGMEKEKLEELDSSMRRTKFDGSHIGFANSLRRVKHFYGEKSDIVISSEIGEGTCVTITIPYNLEVEDESFDCE